MSVCAHIQIRTNTFIYVRISMVLISTNISLILTVLPPLLPRLQYRVICVITDMPELCFASVGKKTGMFFGLCWLLLSQKEPLCVSYILPVHTCEGHRMETVSPG